MVVLMMVMTFLDVCGGQWNIALLYQSKKKNAKIRWKKERNILRNLSVISQKKDLQAWKDSVSYGNRWIVETVFSCLKRTFGEHVYSVKLKIRYRR
jgi:hypothetical protein